MTELESIRVAIVEDDRRIRETVAQLIDRASGMSCIGAWRMAEDALRDLIASPADVLLLDIHLPGVSGSEAVQTFRERWPSMAVLMFTVFESDARVFESLCNGATGYLLKKTEPARLIEAIREAHAGGAPMSPDIARRVVELFRAMRPAPKGSNALTRTEVRMLGLLADGHSYQSAANEMEISINTVRNHIRSIYEKLHVHSCAEAVSKALRNGII